uniref:(northern house mosquito) hypothetical protein n=1 Tax=Culex pipiens TaxID=7175 RepID=A0A8D8AT61_CULPI
MNNIRYKPWFSKPCAPKFDGNMFGYPAVEFIQDFEEYISWLQYKYRVNEWTKRNLFLSCLEKDARLWAKVFGSKNQTCEDLMASFLRRFWGADIQRRIKEEFFYGTYRQKGQWSKMGLYFIGMLRRVSHVILSLPDYYFLETIGFHFPHHIQLQLMKRQSAEEAYLYLLEVDRSLNTATQIYKERQQRQQLVHSGNRPEYRVNSNSDAHLELTNLIKQHLPDDLHDGGCNTTAEVTDRVFDTTAPAPESLGSSSRGRCNEAAEGHNNNDLLEVKGSEINTTTDEDQPTPGLVFVGRVKTRQSKPRAKKKSHGKRGKR